MFKVDKKELQSLRTKNKKILKTGSTKENPVLKWYKFKNPVIQGINYFIVSLCKIIPPSGIKNSLYRLIGVKIGKNVGISINCLIDPIFPELIIIEDNVILGWASKLYTHEFIQNGYRIGSIIVKKNSAIGECSVVRPGITIEKNALVGAMSFVNKDVKANSVVGGVPIKKIRKKSK